MALPSDAATTPCRVAFAPAATFFAAEAIDEGPPSRKAGKDLIAPPSEGHAALPALRDLPHPAERLAAPDGLAAPATELPASAADTAAQPRALPSLLAASTRAPSSAPAHPSPEPQTTPITQIAPALIRLSSDAGTHRVTVLLSPAELGRVQISVVRDQDGTATVNVSAERPETLAAVRADSTQLNAALDKAGIAAHGRSLQFHLTAPVAAPDRAIIADEDSLAPTNVTPANVVRAPAESSSTDGHKSHNQNGSTDQPFDQGSAYDAQRGPTSGGQPRHEQAGHRSSPGQAQFGEDVGRFIDAAAPGVIMLGQSGHSAIDFTA